MEIEVGKFYMTQDGLKVRIYATDGTEPYVIHGAIAHSTWKPCSWTQCGHADYFREENYLDIVSVWEEPVSNPNLMAFIDPKGHIVFQREWIVSRDLHLKRVPWLDEP